VADIYREPEDGFGMQYSVPINTEPPNSPQGFDATGTNEMHPYHELEPTSEVMPSTGHHYHLLDVSDNPRWSRAVKRPIGDHIT
jgi:hypothetical protein